MLYRVVSLAVVAALASAASGQIRITEAASAGSGGIFTRDWFELTNLGSSAVNISGWRMDDSSASFGLSAALNGITSIAPGESVIFFEGAGTTTQIADFRTIWNLSSSVQIGSYSGNGLGLSTAGDGVVIFADATTVIDSVTFGSATGGSSSANPVRHFGFNPVTSVFGGLQTEGVFGAYRSSDLKEIGSPGLIPAPTGAALLGLAGLAASRRRR